METLAARIERKGALRDIDAVGWIIRLAKRIEALHALGAVHSTISPHCMLIEGDACTSPGRLAELQAPRELPAYHSPERAAGGGPSRSDDVWALSVMLYEALSGLVPYPAARDEDVLQAVAEAAPPPLAVFGVGDEELQAIVDRALAREGPRRITDIGRLRRLLETWRPIGRLGVLPPLDDAIPEGGDYDDDDFDPDAVTRIRADITPMLADLLKSAAPTSTPLPAAKPKSEAPAKPSSSAPAPRRAPLMGLSSLGLGPTSTSVVRRLPLPPAPAPDEPSAPEPQPEVSAGAPPSYPAPQAPAVELPAAVPDAAASADLPSLLDEEAAGPEPDDPLAMPGSWTKLDAPRRSGAETASAAAPARTNDAKPASPAKGAAPRKEPARASPAAPAEPAPRSRSGIILAFTLALLGGGAAAWIWGRPEPTPPPPTVQSAPPLQSAPHEPASAAPEVPASAAPEMPASASAPAPSAEPADTASPAAPDGITACMIPLFPEDTFDAKAKPSFEFMCAETDPRRGIKAIKREVVLGDKDGSVSDGMREWALLGWYELAAYTVMRARCCPHAPALKLPAAPTPCEPLDQVLNNLGAAAAVKDAKDKDINAAIKRFTDEVYCLVKMGGTMQYGHAGPPKGGEDTAFRKTLARVTKR